MISECNSSFFISREGTKENETECIYQKYSDPDCYFAFISSSAPKRIFAEGNDSGAFFMERFFSDIILLFKKKNKDNKKSV